MRRRARAVSLKSRKPVRNLEVGVLRDGVDLRFHDRVALDEIELYAEVLSAVATASRRLTAAELDEVLGLHHTASADACTHN